jgi:hypothetical protein
MRLSIVLIVIGLCIAYVLPSSAKSGNEAKQNDDNSHTITQEEIVRLTNEFMDILVQETDENYQVKAYLNKASLLEAFNTVTRKEVAKSYVDHYFYEENGALYIIPTETPPWFDKQNEYDVIQLEKNKVLVQQENQSELYGEYGIDIVFTYADQEWKITNITHH